MSTYLQDNRKGPIVQQDSLPEVPTDQFQGWKGGSWERWDCLSNCQGQISHARSQWLVHSDLTWSPAAHIGMSSQCTVSLGPYKSLKKRDNIWEGDLPTLLIGEEAGILPAEAGSNSGWDPGPGSGG